MRWKEEGLQPTTILALLRMNDGTMLTRQRANMIPMTGHILSTGLATV